MYRILIADDENIVIESLKFIIKAKLGDNCEIECAKTGRSVIEAAENFRPDIAFMDIHMPGINGIDAMKEIRKNNNSIIFIVMTAFDKFDYARETIKIGVLEYLSKPANREDIETVLSKAMGIIDKRREIRTRDLTIKEKLETIIPFMENGLIYTLLLGEDNESISKYREILGISEEFGYIMVVEAKQEFASNMTNVVGSSVRLEDHYELIKESVKDEINAVVGPVMTNKIIILAPFDKNAMPYEYRTKLVERVRTLIHNLENDINIELKVGIGNVKNFEKLNESYHEAISALSIGNGSVLHALDVKIGCEYEDDYPIDTERNIFDAVEKGDADRASNEALHFWNWMVNYHADAISDIQIKVIDFVLRAEQKVYNKTNSTYRFTSRTNYLEAVTGAGDLGTLKHWYLEKITEAARKVSKVQDDIQKTPVEKALNYINENFGQDISLDEMSQMLGISSYYFSKLFKNETGTNFIEYLTNLRISKAKDLLDENRLSVKEIGITVGYPDPNYFSRIFKKNVGQTPSEYKGAE